MVQPLTIFSAMASQLFEHDMTTQPSFEEPYPLLTLPRIPELKLDEKAVVSTVLSIDSNVIDVGISKSIISSYIIKPTPKLIWSHALSPTVIVDCMDVFEGPRKLYITGITERSKYHKLLLLSRDTTQTNTNAETKIFELKVAAKVKGVKFFNEGKTIAAVFANGSVETYNCEDEEIIKTDKSFTSFSSKNETLEHLEFINDIEIPNNTNELLMLVYSNKKTKTLVYQLVSLNFTNKFFEVNSYTEDLPDTKVYFAYNGGYLYVLNAKSKEISRKLITSFKTEQQISIAPLLNDDAAVISLYAPSVDRLLLSVGGKIHLVNFKFASILDTLTADQTLISQVVKVKGNTARTTKSMVFYLNAKSKDNNIDLNVLNFNTGFNILSECLGKSINTASTEGFKGLISLVDHVEDEDVSKNSTTLASELEQVYNELEKLAEAGDVGGWDHLLVTYLKNTPYDKVSEDMRYSEEFQEFDVDNDRIVDTKFFEKVLGLVFKREEDEGEEERLEFMNMNFVPEMSLIYLLTNPIFPSIYTKGLLDLFNSANQINLLRQAISTCPNLPIQDLLVQLLNEEDAEIFQDLINRLINEYSINSITKNMKVLISETDDLTGFLNKLLNTNYNINNWYFIELLIDVGGLFNWSLNVVDQLNKVVEDKVQILLENSYNLTLTKQTLTVSGPVKKKSSGKKNNNKDIVALNNTQQSQLESILTIHNSTTNTRLLEDDFKKLPTYSIEKLVL